ncbi:MAG: hypothetical protein IKR19_08285 [Acholeplasmatales bacterium]|nr:hypothetical protein [Acholeplasmatales bacterium]
MNPLQIGYSGVGGINATPLIAFNTIIDEDFSLISYIIKYVRNHNIFDLDKLKFYTVEKIISELYLRTYDNPLYFLMKDEKDKEFLDQCYNEFKQTQEYYDYFSISTDFYSAVSMFKESGEISATILYKTQKELDLIKNDELLSSLNVLSIDDVTSKSIQKYKQFYFFKMDDIEPFIFPDNTYKTYYISSMGLNLNDSKDSIKEDKYSKYIDDLYKYKNQVNIFDVYKQQTIGRAIY